MLVSHIAWPEAIHRDWQCLSLVCGFVSLLLGITDILVTLNIVVGYTFLCDFAAADDIFERLRVAGFTWSLPRKSCTQCEGL